jgi:hypothetical protein
MHRQSDFLWCGAGVLAVTTAALILLIAGGHFDPRPVGPLRESWPAADRKSPPLTEQLAWLDDELPPPPFSLRLRAGPDHGAVDVGYGLMLQNGSESLAIAVSPAGYAAVWRTVDNEVEMIQPWQTWPHIRRMDNELWLDVQDEALTIRFNRELYARLPLTAVPRQVGYYLINFEAGQDAVIRFGELQLFGHE